MSTWLFFMGLQMIIFIATGIWVIIWMRQKPDELDDKLDQMNAADEAAMLEKAKEMGIDVEQFEERGEKK